MSDERRAATRHPTTSRRLRAAVLREGVFPAGGTPDAHAQHRRAYGAIPRHGLLSVPGDPPDTRLFRWRVAGYRRAVTAGPRAIRAVDRLELLEAATRADRNAGERALGQVYRHVASRAVAARRGPGAARPPPASTIPRSMMSAASSGGVLSSVDLIASMICETGSSSARRISSDEMITVFGRPGEHVATADLRLHLLASAGTPSRPRA